MNEKRARTYDLLLIAVLLIAAYLRLTGLDWGQGQHQHPDELFLSGVVENLRAHTCMDEGTPIDACPLERQRWLTPLEFFDTSTSTLNPHNRGAGFYVYGTLPLFLVRFTYELLGPDVLPIKSLARQYSALADLFTILILYFIVVRIYGRRTALLATLFSALAVMQIQQSHYFTVDLFVNPFMYLALYFAVRIAYDKGASNDQEVAMENEPGSGSVLNRTLARFSRDPIFWNSIFFGLALGLAAACKVNAIVLAVVLPGALILRFNKRFHISSEEGGIQPRSIKSVGWSRILVYLFIGGAATFLAFRLFQPYAFNGVLLNPQWLANLKELRGQATGEADLPWNLQWARRNHLYSFTNLTIWGLGLPLGILAWAGFIAMGWRILKGDHQHLLLWAWTAVYFGWQSLQFNATMRYQLPIYPLLCMMAAWLIFRLADSKVRPLKWIALSVGVLVLALTAIWAFAFASIYTRDETRVAASRWIFQNVPGPITLRFEDGASQPLTFPYGGTIESGIPYQTIFSAGKDGTLTRIFLPHVQFDPAAPVTLSLSLLEQTDAVQPLAVAGITPNSTVSDDPRGGPVTLTLDHPVELTQGITYTLRIETTGTVMLSGSAISNETDYDWSLPFRTDGYDPFGGLYRGDLNLQVYWDDNPDKVLRFQNTLNETDFIFVPTNHQYAQITRLPERYPLTTVYYRELIGCPPEENIIWCYQVAQPGTFNGRLGFDLVQVFESYPTLGRLTINDQAAEEAFTFYDHPKVLIFQKSADYDPALVRTVLGAVDLSQVVHLTPKEAGKYEFKDLMLPPDRLVEQRAGGTWSDLFSYDWLQNKYPVLGLLLWYALIFLLGLVAYPLTRLALPGLGSYAYALSRIVGLALLAYLAWLGGSLGLPYTRTSIALVFALITVTGLAAGWLRREGLRTDWNSNRRIFLTIEILFFAFFVFDLLIRLGNPDMWHPSKGGERPMDFSYFNAILKSTSFPPYDPWFAGGYINYYYYGFVLVGTPVKLLGIVPTIAYNLILPTLFALVAIGAFTVASQLFAHSTTAESSPTDEKQLSTLRLAQGNAFNLQLLTGIAAAVMMVMLGNLGTLQMLFRGFQRLAAPGGVIEDASFPQRIIWAFKGFFTAMVGGLLPFGNGDWYWNPSRVIPPGPGNEITEFPFFTFLYGDLHAHMIVMPLALFVIAWALSFVMCRARLSRAEWLATFLAGGLFIGALRPTNTWDLYTYFALAAVSLIYTIWRYGEWKESRFGLPAWLGRILLGIGAAGLLYLVASWLYSPFTYWYSQAYGSIDPWNATHTPLASYLTHWSLFLVIIIFWLIWETRQWMASTPVSSLEKLRSYQLLIEGALAVLIVLLVYFVYKGVSVGWLALPLAAWAGILLLRPDQPDAKRVTLFMIGTALTLTLGVELYTLRGDIGRANTIFKLYLQAWTMLAVSSAAALGWLLPHIPTWRRRWRNLFQVGLAVLLAGAFLYTLTAMTDKVRDRLAPMAPHTLDSMTYMNHAVHWDGADMDLSEDYRAIRWLQDNVQGSPVIVEINVTEYRWGTRYTIYTGLPGVVGWNFHQRQQRALIPPNLITDRVDQIGIFYTTTEVNVAREFLARYEVKYIIVGQLERIHHPEGIAKFDQYDGQYWRSVYRDGDTVIYEVLP